MCKIKTTNQCEQLVCMNNMQLTDIVDKGLGVSLQSVFMNDSGKDLPLL